MSDNLARAIRPRPVDPGEHGNGGERRHIEIVTPTQVRRARPRLAYALTALAGMAAIVVAQLLLSVGISQGAYELSTLQAERVELGRTADSVREDLVRVSSPQSLAANAEALGMVNNSNPVYLRLSDAAVLGVPVAAAGGQDAAAALVPNALLEGVPLVADLPPTSAPPGVAASAPASAPVASPVVPVTPAAPPAAPAPAQNGLPSPTTR